MLGEWSDETAKEAGSSGISDEEDSPMTFTPGVFTPANSWRYAGLLAIFYVFAPCEC